MTQRQDEADRIQVPDPTTELSESLAKINRLNSSPAASEYDLLLES